MRIHILGVCGTFMSGVALLAKQCGHDVSGSDMNVYPPMSTQLDEQGIQLYAGYDPAHLAADLDYVIVGNVIKRGNPVMEYVLAQQIPFISGPEWLATHILKNRHVIAVAGTHGKTTTSSLLAWILMQTQRDVGFLIGGIPENFGVSARLGHSPYFVIEADEYDSAFYDKRPKFMHYWPNTLVLNNLEYDHADIFPDITAIEQQFHYLVRTVSAQGTIICQAQDEHLRTVLAQGSWSQLTFFDAPNSDWHAHLRAADGSQFAVFHREQLIGEVDWQLIGKHNVSNALAALAATHSIGVDAAAALAALSSFRNVKRRLEIKAQSHDITFYDDFAHHPTAIATTLAGLRAKIGSKRLVAVLEFGSYTMRTGTHKNRLLPSLAEADIIVCKDTDSDWGLHNLLTQTSQPTYVYRDTDSLVAALIPLLQPHDHVVVMSNGGFNNIHQKLLSTLNAVQQRFPFTDSKEGLR